MSLNKILHLYKYMKNIASKKSRKQKSKVRRFFKEASPAAFWVSLKKRELSCVLSVVATSSTSFRLPSYYLPLPAKTLTMYKYIYIYTVPEKGGDESQPS